MNDDKCASVFIYFQWISFIPSLNLFSTHSPTSKFYWHHRGTSTFSCRFFCSLISVGRWYSALITCLGDRCSWTEKKRTKEAKESLRSKSWKTTNTFFSVFYLSSLTTECSWNENVKYQRFSYFFFRALCTSHLSENMYEKKWR